MKFWLPVTLAVFAGAGITPTARSCPAFFNIQSNHAWSGQTDLRKVKLYTFSSKNGWLPEPFQVVPMTPKLGFDTERVGNLRKKDNVASWTVNGQDRFMFETKNFKERRTENNPLPCNGRSALELSSKTNADTTQYAYLVDCRTDPATEISRANPVSIQPSLRQISSAEYVYTYHPKNELLYESLIAKSSDGALVRAAHQSDVAIRLDIQNFFTLEFNNDDLESYVVASQNGPIGLIESVSFFLRLFAFKIDLEINTVASFFEKSASIPMIVDVPKNAPDVLNPGSGPMYSFKIDQAVFEPGHKETTMPVYSKELFAMDVASRTKMALQHCGPEQCRFRLMGRLKNDPVALDLLIAKSTVALGFYPNLIEDVAKFRADRDWKKDKNADAQSKALYFETSGLPKGRYLAETWIVFGEDTKIAGGCPATVQLTATGH